MLKVVYDVDDVLWPLNERVFAKLGLDYCKDITYNLKRNQLLTSAQQCAVLDAFQQTETFVDMNFYQGAAEILQAEPLGATIRIHSHCYSVEIAKLKCAQLRQLLPQMKPAFIKMSIISTSPNNKQIDADAFIFVDDNPYNINVSKAPVNIVPRQPWNTTAEATQVLMSNSKVLVESGWQTVLPELITKRQRCVIMAQTLQEVNQIVKQAIKSKQEA